MTHPLNSHETAVVLDLLHSQLKPNEYIKHDDSPIVWLEQKIDDKLTYVKYIYNINGQYFVYPKWIQSAFSGLAEKELMKRYASDHNWKP